MPATTTRPKPERSVRLLTIGEARVLVITMKTRARASDCMYHLTRIPSDFGVAFELAKSECCGSETYHVSIGGAAYNGNTCECKGFLRWGRTCKHIASLKKLLELNRI
jgi:hypothetical protein